MHKFGFWGTTICAENHEFSTVVLDKPFDKVKSKSCESVTVGNHNFLDISATDCFQ
jgi:diphthamide synthase (EF-2-diphthine--ammonia ligase)